MKKVTMTKMKRRKKDSGSEEVTNISEETIMPPMKPLPLMLVPMVPMLAMMKETTVKEMMKEMMKAKVMTMKVKMTKEKKKKDSGSEEVTNISEVKVKPPET